MATCRTSRGVVYDVIDRDCARRPCLHVHWDRSPYETKTRANGDRVQKHHLICQRNKDHGCPYPMPAPGEAA